MQRYAVSKFDEKTFLVVDQIEKREICVCQNYDDFDDAKSRAAQISILLNTSAKHSRNSLNSRHSR